MCFATASTSAGSQSKSGKPCERLIAPRSAASFDITVKIVVPTLGSLDLIDTAGHLSELFCSRLEHARLPVLAHGVPPEMPAVHRHVDARWQHLNERQRAAEIEQSVRAAERVRDHRAGQDDRLV